MGKADEKKLYVGREGGWGLVLASLSFLAIRLFGEKRGEGEKKCRVGVPLYYIISPLLPLDCWHICMYREM